MEIGEFKGTWTRSGNGMEKRHRSINDQRISREEESDEAVSRLVKERTSDDMEKFCAFVEQYVEQNRAQPKKKSGIKESPNHIALSITATATATHRYRITHTRSL